MIGGPSRQAFDAAALKQEFPGLADPRLHYLDNAATAQMPEVVLDALRRFEVEARANVHEGMHGRARAATHAYNEARTRVARFLHAGSDQEVVFTYGTTSSINGPTGIGVLWGRGEFLETLPPFMTGGQMIDQVTLTETSFRPPPRRFEAGTPPIGPAIGLGAGLNWMQGLDWEAIRKHELRLTRRILDGLASLAGVRVLGPADTRDRRGVVSFSVDGFSAEDVCRHLDTHGVALRGGYHCAQPLVRAFGVEGAARASLAPYSVDADVEALLEGIEELVRNRLTGAPQPRAAVLGQQAG